MVVAGILSLWSKGRYTQALAFICGSVSSKICQSVFYLNAEEGSRDAGARQLIIRQLKALEDRLHRKHDVPFESVGLWVSWACGFEHSHTNEVQGLYWQRLLNVAYTQQ
jgi:hypothetical protein